MRTPLFAAVCLLVVQSHGVGASAKEAPKADNTAQNHGAMRDDSVTAQKQHNSKTEVTVLADIRKSIMAEKGLSIDAQNVKIVYSNNGLVILRGPVDSADERTKVAELAKGCAGVTSIKDELTVAVKPH